MNNKNRLSKLWSVYIGEFHNPDHNKIKNDLINYFNDYMKKKPNSRRGGENYKLFESEYNLHTQNNEYFKKLTTFIANGILATSNEANKSEIKKGGVIVDSSVHQRICLEIKKWFIEECEMQVKGIIQSPIKGPKGNIEFLILVKKIREIVNSDQQ